jgi:hypothetical protein
VRARTNVNECLFIVAGRAYACRASCVLIALMIRQYVCTLLQRKLCHFISNFLLFHGTVDIHGWFQWLRMYCDLLFSCVAQRNVANFCQERQLCELHYIGGFYSDFS